MFDGELLATDTYTDPQVLTLDGQGYGKGNTGEKGIENFLDGHWCNSLWKPFVRLAFPWLYELHLPA